MWSMFYCFVQPEDEEEEIIQDQTLVHSDNGGDSSDSADNAECGLMETVSE